jgi:4-hydroxythreonine-4-phosphate dehydrogenase
LIVSTGCPAGIGPEVSVVAAARCELPIVLVGDPATLIAAAELRRVPRARLVTVTAPEDVPRGKVGVLAAGEPLAERDRRPGRPSRRAGRAQLEYIHVAHALCESGRGAALVTGPVSKWAVTRSGAPNARRFMGHTEWLCALEGRASAVMCFVAPRLSTALVTTHLPLSRVSRALDASGIATATVALSTLLRRLGRARPRVVVCSLNPHAGEGGLLGGEERLAIAPGIARARRKLRGTAELSGPIGAETAYRKALAGEYDGVVAMYHDQATIPMKLVAFSEAVNVTMGLGVVRTSVDHGTAYDIAWRGRAEHEGMLAAMRLASILARGSQGGRLLAEIGKAGS